MTLRHPNPSACFPLRGENAEAGAPSEALRHIRSGDIINESYFVEVLREALRGLFLRSGVIIQESGLHIMAKHLIVIHVLEGRDGR